MEEICWVTTPPCSKCSAPPEFARRFPCIGCEKRNRRKETFNAPVKRSMTNSDRQIRNRKIGEMREKGFSFERIAIILKMPRATVQSAAASFVRQKCADYVANLLLRNQFRIFSTKGQQIRTRHVVYLA